MVVGVIDAGVLAVRYLEDGPPDGWLALLSHGFPVRKWSQVVPRVSTAPWANQ
jgi:hypothetical protein